MAKDFFVTPKCCNEVKEKHTVFLRHSRDEIYTRNRSGQKDLEPEWYCMIYDTKGGMFDRVKVNFCPHCSKRLPDIERRKTDKPICDITDGGFYCNTCKRKLCECGCYPPEYAWKPQQGY